MSVEPASGDGDDLVSMLTEAISVQSLTTDGGTILDIDPIGTMEDNAAKEELYYPANFIPGNNLHYFSIGKDADGNEIRGSPGMDPFETFAPKMTNVGGDSQVKKRILRQGVGPVIPPGANVHVQYNAYFEYCDEPFDSTFSLGKPAKFSVLDCIEGLGIAISTMKKKEQAQFLIHPNKAYKSIGVPPRIPANAEILYEVELLDFTEGSGDETLGNVVTKKTFPVILAASKVKYLEGNDCFSKGNIHGAILNYNKALGMLERCNLANQEEEDQQQSLMLKMYTNLAVCMNKERKPRQACNMCKCAIKIKPNHAKAFFNFGRALFMLGDYKEARLKLKRAEHLEPNNLEIKAELNKVDLKQRNYDAQEKLFSERMLRS